MTTEVSQVCVSLREHVLGAKEKKDSRWAFGTTCSSSYTAPPPSAYEMWKPLPVSHLQGGAPQAGRSRAAIFPRTECTFSESKAKMVSKLTEFVDACKVLDVEGDEGVLSEEDVISAMKEVDMCMTGPDLENILPKAPRDTNYHIKYVELANNLLAGDTLPNMHMTPSGVIAGAPVLPDTFEWPEGAGGFEVTLRIRPYSSPFTLDEATMQRYASKARAIRRLESTAEKVHGMLRHAMIMELVVNAGALGLPDLSFRNWLADNGLLSLTTREVPGPIIPEVYDVLDQVIYEAFGIPRVVPVTQVLTSFQSTMYRTTMGTLKSTSKTMGSSSQ